MNKKTGSVFEHTSTERSTVEEENFGLPERENEVFSSGRDKIFLPTGAHGASLPTGAHGAMIAFQGFWKILDGASINILGGGIKNEF